MCGICGVVSVDRQERVDPAVLLRMRETIRHRGPDQAGLYVAPGVGLGHRRLSIIDLRAEGRQPMTNEDGQIVTVFNGEIYNYQSLRAELLARGHTFGSNTDTEVIVHLYEEYGEDCVHHLRGMFALAVWDEPRRILLLARDRAGKKPLFYRFDGKRLLFASEAKAILSFPGVVAEPDPEAIHHYLGLGYVPGPFSAFKGIRKLPPAHTLVFEDGRIRIQRYWSLNYRPKLKIDEREACDEIISRLTEATRLRMISDVPLGAFLSGGIDSSAIVAVMAGLSSRPVKTFSIGFKEAEYDETAYARMIAQRFATDHHEFVVEPEDAATVITNLGWHYDEPYADSSAVPTYYLSKLTREHVTVALNGDAGDENFAGYRRYQVSLWASRMGWAPPVLRRVAGKTFALAYRRFSHNSRLAARLGILDEVLDKDWQSAYARMVAMFSDDEKAALYTPDFAAQNPHSTLSLVRDLYAQAQADNPLDATLSVDVNSYLPDDLLVKVDRASMAVALEARSPMVDHEFMEFAARLPAHFKMTLRGSKVILKQALASLLPPTILKRTKMGFGAPIDHWMRGSWQGLLTDTLLSSNAVARGYFRKDELQRLIQEHGAGRRSHQTQLWTLLMLEVWHRTFIDQPSAHSCPRPAEVNSVEFTNTGMPGG